MRTCAILLACVAASCTGSSTSPSRASVGRDTPAATASATLAGLVTATNGGQVLPSLAIAIGPETAISNAGGAFSVTLPAPATYSVTMNGAIVPRVTYVTLSASRTVAIDAIALAGFDLGFYRQLVRNGFDAPGTSQPLRRWTQAPQLYLQTIDTAGRAIDSDTLALAERTFQETAPIWTAGTFGVASVTRGTSDRFGQPGWITVIWEAGTTAAECGRADVALSGGAIHLDYLASGCACGGLVKPKVLRHELGHALGFWHTDAPSDIMYPQVGAACDAMPSDRERAAAAIAYRRPIGNVDPDTDPSGTVNLQPMTAR